MSSQPKGVRPPLDLSKWRNVPLILMAGGGLLALIGFFVDREQFAFSWLQAFMFSLSLCLVALFLVIMHHLFDAGWSVPIRRFCEHIATLSFPLLLVLFIPIVFMAPTLYEWMRTGAKLPLFTKPGFYGSAAGFFFGCGVRSHRFRV